MEKEKKLQTWQIVTLVGLTLCIIVLAVLLVLKNNWFTGQQAPFTLTEFEHNFSIHGKEIKELADFQKQQTKKTDTKRVFTLADDFYLGVLLNHQEQVTKSYYYVKKDLYSTMKMATFLVPLIQSMDSQLSKEDATKVAQQLTDITHKQADELGFLVQFQKNHYEYMLLEKEKGAYLQFFITKIDQK